MTLNNWNQEYVIFVQGSTERKVPRSQFFQHTGFTQRPRYKTSKTKVMTLEEASQKDQKYLQSLATTQQRRSHPQTNSKENFLPKEKPKTEKPKPKKRKDPLGDLGF